jgi:16S rRNA pseudouridine516 synthase
MPKKIKIRQFLMTTGKFNSAFDCEKAIRLGKIKVNGFPLINPNYYFDPKRSIVEYNGKKLKKAKQLYYIFNKPAGYLCQKSKSEKTVYSLINKLDISTGQKKSLFTVGRLDKDTEGLLIITNDGVLSKKILAPVSEIKKKYYVELNCILPNTEVIKLEGGVFIDVKDKKYKTKQCKIKKLSQNKVYIAITEGKKRQIRKMFESIGSKVEYLKRISIADVKLNNLKTGDFKRVTKEYLNDNLNIKN